jgi:DNA-binding HxlR family transcriptional regulator
VLDAETPSGGRDITMPERGAKNGVVRATIPADDGGDAAMGGKYGDELCPRYQRAIDIVGKRWTCLILRVLLAGPRRFGYIENVVDGLSARMLSERLKELESCGIVERRVYPETPVRIEYQLTEKGRGLQRALDELQQWADRWECAAEPEPAGASVNRRQPAS